MSVLLSQQKGFPTVFVALVAFAGTGPFRFSCNESLPPYDPPGTLFEGTLRGQTVPTKVEDRLYCPFLVFDLFGGVTVEPVSYVFSYWTGTSC
jgi:hypothetical protein